ncbi:hypothetical protein BT69DRAFT_1334104 [Atractiella rhizophila]|nr:hypothetical protein BT69DRAFT_1334104 [Atractiella rhizophila]
MPGTVAVFENIPMTAKGDFEIALRRTFEIYDQYWERTVQPLQTSVVTFVRATDAEYAVSALNGSHLWSKPLRAWLKDQRVPEPAGLLSARMAQDCQRVVTENLVDEKDVYCFQVPQDPMTREGCILAYNVIQKNLLRQDASWIEEPRKKRTRAQRPKKISLPRLQVHSQESSTFDIAPGGTSLLRLHSN